MKPTLTLLLLLAAIAGRGQDKRQTRVIPATFLVTDLAHSFAYALKGYVKQELHNTSEGVNDAGGVICHDDLGNEIPCYADYWETVENLGKNKRRLPSSVTVWQTSK